MISNASQHDLDRMHALYRKGGKELRRAPHIVYQGGLCPHAGCLQHLHAINFRLEAYGREIHDPLVCAWWDDTGFAGKCPTCGGWIHFTIRGKQAIGAEEATALPILPEDWHKTAVIL